MFGGIILAMIEGLGVAIGRATAPPPQGMPFPEGPPPEQVRARDPLGRRQEVPGRVLCCWDSPLLPWATRPVDPACAACSAQVAEGGEEKPGLLGGVLGGLFGGKGKEEGAPAPEVQDLSEDKYGPPKMPDFAR